jgi:GT2 family glycosyltransferase
MKITKDITGIIVLYDTTIEVIDCLQRLKDIKFIIVDNGKCDKEIIDKVLKFKNIIKYFKPKKNLGFGRANNFAFKYVNTKYTLLINADIKTSVKDIEKLVDTFDKYPNTGISVPMLVNKDMINIDYLECLPEIKSNYTYLVNDKKKLISGDTSISFCWAAIMLLNNKIFKKINIFDKKYFLFWEDYDLCRRLYKKKIPIIKTYLSKAYHLKHKSVKDNYRNYFKIQTYHTLSSYIYFSVNKKDKILIKRFFIYLFRSISYLFILNIKGSLKNIARITAIIKYKKSKFQL